MAQVLYTLGTVNNPMARVELNKTADLLNNLLPASHQTSIVVVTDNLVLLVGSYAAKTKYDSIVNKKG